MSLLNKLRQLAVEQSVHVPPATNPIPKAPEPIAVRPEILPEPPPKKISRGRPRKQYRRKDYQADSVRAVATWASERLIPARNCAVYIGTASEMMTKKTASGRLMKYAPYYEATTLRNDFRQYCIQKKWPPLAIKHFSGVILKHLTEQGIPASVDRSYRHRRAILRGVTLQGSQPWDGNENLL